VANIVTGNYALRMDLLDVANLWGGTVTERSDTKLTIDIGGGYVEHFTGFGVTYNIFGEPLSGTITGLQETVFGDPTFTITGLNTSAVTFNNWVDADDTLGALNGMLQGNDDIRGGRFNDFLAGLDGHDNLYGGDGADTLSGGNGNDHLYGQSANGGSDGADLISGGAGSDYLQGNAGNDTLDGGDGSDRINGGADNDVISGGVGIGNDTINGNLGNDTIDGGDGDDFLRGGKGDDLIKGGDGNDTLMGDLGNDTLEGGHSHDMMTGGDGADVFRFDAYSSADADSYISPTFQDGITDFVSGTDHIDLAFTVTSVLHGTARDSLIDGLSVAMDLMQNHAGYGEVVALQVGADTVLYHSGMGTSDSPLSIVWLLGVNANTITTSDFI
jgi:serralysin